MKIKTEQEPKKWYTVVKEYHSGGTTIYLCIDEKSNVFHINPSEIVEIDNAVEQKK